MGEPKRQCLPLTPAGAGLGRTIEANTIILNR
jgi:hypothetical protein